MPKMTFVSADGQTRTEVEAPLGLSVLEIAHRHGIDLEGACEGSLACSTCHVLVSPEWFDQAAMPEAIASLADYARNGITVATGHMSAPTMTVLNRLFHERPGDLAIRCYPALDFLRQNPEIMAELERQIRVNARDFNPLKVVAAEG